MPEWTVLLAALPIGLIAGAVGGLAGVGGSMVILPALHLVLGEPEPGSHHLYMAAAMCVNVAIAGAATRRHWQSGFIRGDLLRVLIPSAVLMIVAGVLVSNLVPGPTLRIALAIAIAAYCLWSLARVIKPTGDVRDEQERSNPRAPTLIASGGLAGFVGGSLGLGGGVVLTPALQVFGHIRLRHAVATSAAVITASAVIGAALKLATLGEHGQHAGDALVLALVMAPTAIVGGRLGAMMAQKLPLRAVRAAITALLLIAAVRLVLPAQASADPSEPPAPKAASPGPSGG